MSSEDVAVVTVVPTHHWLVRLSHWLNVVLLVGLTMSGLSIYWASPVFLHPTNPVTGSRDRLGDVSVWLATHLPLVDHTKPPRDFLYDHLGLGTFALAQALQLHWLFAYAFMLTGLLYAVGLLAGRGWRALVPSRHDPREAASMIRYYGGVIPAKVLRREWPHPRVTRKYNALQRGAYAAMPLVGLAVIASGWAMHKPVQLWWLERLFGSYDGARIVHFLAMVVFLAFVGPHVVLVVADGWDTMRSMITGWSLRVPVTEPLVVVDDMPAPAEADAESVIVDQPPAIEEPAVAEEQKNEEAGDAAAD
jgi:thiosulfate reductase cytochrome b subunit